MAAGSTGYFRRRVFIEDGEAGSGRRADANDQDSCWVKKIHLAGAGCAARSNELLLTLVRVRK